MSARKNETNSTITGTGIAAIKIYPIKTINCKKTAFAFILDRHLPVVPDIR